MTSWSIDKKLEIYKNLEIELEIDKNLEIELEIYKNLENFEFYFEIFVNFEFYFEIFVISSFLSVVDEVNITFPKLYHINLTLLTDWMPLKISYYTTDIWKTKGSVLIVLFHLIFCAKILPATKTASLMPRRMHNPF